MAAEKCELVAELESLAAEKSELVAELESLPAEKRELAAELKSLPVEKQEPPAKFEHQPVKRIFLQVLVILHVKLHKQEGNHGYGKCNKCNYSGHFIFTYTVYLVVFYSEKGTIIFKMARHQKACH
ncbi:hypothetical protein ACPCXA_08785 [Lysinibacillus agricola]